YANLVYGIAQLLRRAAYASGYESLLHESKLAPGHCVGEFHNANAGEGLARSFCTERRCERGRASCYSPQGSYYFEFNETGAISPEFTRFENKTNYPFKMFVDFIETAAISPEFSL